MNLSRSRLMLLSGWVLLFQFVAGCSKPGSSPAADATLAVPSLTVTFSAASDLTMPISPDLQGDFQLTDPEVISAPLIFAHYRNDALGLRTPLILRRASESWGGQWKVLQLPTLQHAEWIYAGAAIGRGELWAILHSASDARDPGLYFLRSTDDGQTWTLFSGLRLPAPTVEFLFFSLDRKGAGSVSVHQEDDSSALPRGVYLYRTADAGKTWTGPAFTPDDLFTADQPASSVSETIKGIQHSPSGSFHPASQPSISRPAGR